MNPTTCHLLWQTLRRRGQQAEPALADGLHVGAVLLQPQGAHHHPAPEQGDVGGPGQEGVVVGADAGPVGALAAAVPAPRGRHAEVRAQRAAHDPPGDGLGHRRAAPYGGERHVRRIFHFMSTVQLFYSRCPLHRDSAEILQFAAETCLSMSTTNHFISLSHGETVNGNRLSDRWHKL